MASTSGRVTTRRTDTRCRFRRHRRHVQGPGAGTMNPPPAMHPPPVAPIRRTVTYLEVPLWQWDNHILTGYRPPNPTYVEVRKSLSFVHNETCNVYTHLIGAIIASVTFVGILIRGTDNNISLLYILCADLCLIFSAAYHLFGYHSYATHELLHRMDLLGIVIATCGAFVPGIFYVFRCQPGLLKLYWSIITISSFVAAALICIPTFRTPQWRKVRLGAYIALGASAFIPLLHGWVRFGSDYMIRYCGIKWYLVEMAFYGGGAALYAARLPERLAPGRFDILGNSHQIFHVCILIAMALHLGGLMQAFDAWIIQDAKAVLLFLAHGARASPEEAIRDVMCMLTHASDLKSAPFVH